MDTTTTPQETPQVPSGLLDSIRQADTGAQNLIDTLQNPPKMGVLQGLGAILAAPQAGAAGQANPILTQHAEEQRRRIEMLSKAQDLRKSRADAALKQNELARTVLKNVLENEELPSEQRVQFAQQYTKLLKDAGIPVPDAISNAWANKGMKSERLRELARDIDSGRYTDEALGQKYAPYGLRPNDITDIRKALDSDEGRHYYGLKTKAENQQESDAAEIRKGQVIKARVPEYSPGTVRGDYMAESFFKSRGKPISDYDPKDPNDVQAMQKAISDGIAGEKKDEQTKREWDEHMASVRAAQAQQKQIDAENRRAGRTPISGSVIDKKTGLLVTPTQADFEADPSRYRRIGASEEQMFVNTTVALRQVHDLGTLMDRLIHKYGVGTLRDGLDDSYLGQATRAWAGGVQKILRNDPDFAQLVNLMTEQNVELARVVGGSGQLRTTVLDKLTEAGLKGWETSAVAHRILGTIETSIWNRRQAIISGGDVEQNRPYPLGDQPRNQPGTQPGAAAPAAEPSGAPVKMTKAESQPDGSRKVTLSDGTQRTVPAGSLLMRAPDGTLGAVPVGRRKDALAKGYTLVK
jgi:hypothetical protein